MMSNPRLVLGLLAAALSASSVHADDLRSAGQALLNKGIESAVTGATAGNGGKQIAKDTQQSVQDTAKQQAAQSASNLAKTAPTADSNPLGALATGMAAQAAGTKAAEAVKGGNSAMAGQMASDLVKGAAGALDQKLHAAPAAAPAPAAAAPTPDQTATAAPAKTKGKKKTKAKKKH